MDEGERTKNCMFFSGVRDSKYKIPGSGDDD